MATFCNNCGKDLLEQARFCPLCGEASRRTVDGSIAFLEPHQGPFCPACGKRSAKGGKYCMWCGLPLHERPFGSGVLSCPTCGEKNPENAGFCASCRFDLRRWFSGGEGEARVLAGRYRMEEELGRGGMGVVYRAFDLNLDIEVAIKMVPKELSKNKQAIGVLKREAQFAISLTHESINRLYTFERTSNEAFLVMEYVPGETLADLLVERGSLGPDEVVDVVISFLAGLEYAHVKGVVHRDIKPANIMVSPDGKAKILDFGIAQAFRETMTRFSKQSSLSSGTLLYMAPEQINGESPIPQTDIYAVGVIMYEMLQGKPPFFRGAIEHQILTKIPESIYGVPRWINDVIEKCLAKQPENRFQTVSELVKALKGGAQGHHVSEAPHVPPVVSTPSSTTLAIEKFRQPKPKDRPSNRSQSRRRLWFVVSGIVAIGVILLGISLNGVLPGLEEAIPPLRVALSGEYMPLHGKAGDSMIGFEADLAKAIAGELGRDVIFVNTWSEYKKGSIESVNKGLVDMSINSITITPERAKKVDFSKPYLYLRYRLAAKNNYLEKAAFREFSGKVAVVFSLAKEAVEANFPSATIVECKSFNICLQLIENGKADYIAGEDVGIINDIAKTGLLVASDPFGSSEIAIALPKGRAGPVNEALRRLQLDIDRFEKKWKPSSVPQGLLVRK